MDLKQVGYFLNLAETLNFTEAAKRSGVSQPSLTRSIQRLEEELGGLLLYRDGKDQRLTSLGRDVQMEFMRIASALGNIREHSENSVHGRWRVLTIGVATTVAPCAFTAFFDHVLQQLPSVEVNIHPLAEAEGIDDLLSGRFHAIIPARQPQAHPKISVQTLYNERFMLGMAQDHPLSGQDQIGADELAKWPYVDRLACEFHSEISEYLMRRDVVMRPRFRAEREDWVQHMVAHGRAICILPERSALQNGLAIRPVTDLHLSRDICLVTISGAGTPVEMRQISRMAAQHDWSMPECTIPSAIETML